MRTAIGGGLLVLVILLGTSCQNVFVQCASDDDCANGRTCVNRRCFGFAVDAGPDAAADLPGDFNIESGPDADVCLPRCGERECGADGCGGSCGECWPGEECHPDGTCGEPLCGNGVIDPGETCEIGFSEELDPDDFCPFGCNENDACTIGELSGDPDECSSECHYTKITDCIDNDDCCPPGCTVALDNDCPSICGDGRVDAAERCDGDCPTRDECDDGAACTVDFRGDPDSCTSQCIRFVRSDCIDGDGCCPADCGATEDSDCPESSCERYCAMAQDYCRGANALFSDTNDSGSADDECLEACENFPFRKGRRRSRDGDTLWCRIYQLSRAITEPEVYCPEASAQGSTECD